ncbi:GTPase-activating protein skywalker isoform X1 [Sitodiplosis mosellana]|uniref:GTPase-activating protein skywalker isoform X1 n=1 Tax=Sitodiplosis mosellana TaxID=263140 RepID=UPI002444304A|nr:GTPase-activating protein skywalker isoform X1 [Sitodiplosis mosellana]XP_055304374.1 GTPase-activating protein skywalker isoform X1 [Sitodiplosis mosellana]XP_055304376.1 GTPase-activating protein skywalker isoform X1 [Sitodiplosis mosellana]XP_055304377.1 GTPase-activating protein skywalker isoform X1 [Sitodiplosis mosellana]XP_055304378.1 GTPase-activating protein skywalker isoform X1 [Sitodiplosis mosellana]XP_055304379.1 GTPase-activating protein skywalker isoform X1 [Sitodiplosis mose
MPLNGDTINADKLSGIDEESDIYEGFSPHVDRSQIQLPDPSPTSEKKPPLKTFEDVQALLSQGKKREVKLLIRDNAWPINSTIRAQLWPAICSQHQVGKSMLEGYYWDMVNQVFGTTELPDKPIMLPPFVDPTHCLPYYLTRKGRAVADRVVSVLAYVCPDITYSPTIYPIAAILLHFMSEEECYHCLANLVAAKEKVFITQTKLLYEVTWKTVMQIAKKHAKSAVAHLQRLYPGQKSERVFMNWTWWVLTGLPFPHLVRVMDCFFHEGIKVFYRISLAILILYQKHIPNVTSAAASMGDGAINTAATSSTSSSTTTTIAKANDNIKLNNLKTGANWKASDEKSNDIEMALPMFCRKLPVSPGKLLRTAFNIRALSSTYISRVFIKTEMVLRSKTILSGSKGLVHSRSSDNLPTSQSQVNIQMISHTLSIREGAHSPDMRVLSMGVYPIQRINSQVLGQDDLFTLWSWLPARITMYTPTLLYTTEEHGCSLTTFYVRVEQHEPTLLMIKTCNNEVFGAYCSTRWFERNLKDDNGHRQAYFGTGETFLFSLYPDRAKYPWVGIDSDKNLGHGSELFMAADASMITIGGGGSQAIWMDENMRYGKTDSCTTFNNPPLCKSGDFEIRVLEVYGFIGA